MGIEGEATCPCAWTARTWNWARKGNTDKPALARICACLFLGGGKKIQNDYGRNPNPERVSEQSPKSGLSLGGIWTGFARSGPVFVVCFGGGVQMLMCAIGYLISAPFGSFGSPSAYADEFVSPTPTEESVHWGFREMSGTENLCTMAKIVSAAISILLLVLVDRAAVEWKRFRGMANEDGRMPPGPIHSNEARWTASPPSAASGNIVADHGIGKGGL